MKVDKLFRLCLIMEDEEIVAYGIQARELATKFYWSELYDVYCHVCEFQSPLHNENLVDESILSNIIGLVHRGFKFQGIVKCTESEFLNYDKNERVRIEKSNL